MAAPHSHPSNSSPLPAAEERSAPTLEEASTGLPSPEPNQYSNKAPIQETINWPREWLENDGMAFQPELDGFNLEFDLTGVIPPGDSSMSLWGGWNLIQELATGNSSEPIREDLQIGSSFQIDAQTEKKKKKALEGLEDEEDEEDLLPDNPEGGNGGGGSGGGGFGSNNGKGRKDGDGGGGDGGAAGGASGSGGNGSSFDPFCGYNGDGDGWYSTMVAVFLLAWLALRSLQMARSAQLPAETTHLDEEMNPGISSKGVGVMGGYWSRGGRSGDDGHGNDAVTGGAGCFDDVLATGLDAQLRALSPTAAAKHISNPATTLGEPLGVLPVLSQTPRSLLLLSYPRHLSTASSTIFTILSRVHSESRTKTNTRNKIRTTSTSNSTYTSSTLDQHHDLRASVESSRFVLNALRAF